MVQPLAGGYNPEPSIEKGLESALLSTFRVEKLKLFNEFYGQAYASKAQDATITPRGKFGQKITLFIVSEAVHLGLNE